MKWEKIERLFISAIFFACVVFSTGTCASAGNLDVIKAAIHKKGAKWIAGETSVSKLSDREKKLRLGLIKPTGADPEMPETDTVVSLDALLTEVPASLDWRANGGYYVTPVKNQGNCGSCWAFATAAALESYNLIRDNTPGFDDNRAEEILLSCAGAGSCTGGSIGLASSYIRDTGLPPESYFPYTVSSSDDLCSNALSGWQDFTSGVDSWTYITTLSVSVDVIKDALNNHGPLVTTLDVHKDFYSYKSGVYEYTTGSYEGGHAVLLVGYTDDDSVGGGGYFIVKNSWGTSWGEGGYSNIAYSQISAPVYVGKWTIAYNHPTQPVSPVAPSNVTATAVSANLINLQWTDNSTNEQGFEIERCTGPGCSNFILLTTVGANTTSFSNQDLASNTTYTYRVRAYNADSDSAYSNTDSATTLEILRALSVAKSGVGVGTVSGSGISCGTDCSEDFSAGTAVTLTAIPDPGSVLAGWSGGGCSGRGVCKVTMQNTPINITVTFNLIGTLSSDIGSIGSQITVAGSGFGNKKGKILIGTATTRIITWSDSSIVFEIMKPLIPGLYEVTVQPKELKYYAAMGLRDVFIIKKPENISVDVDSGLPGDQIKITGNYFGSKKGKIYLENQVSRKKLACRVFSWSMDPATGESAVVFAVPKPVGYVHGVSTLYTLKVTNKVGTATTTFMIN